jgi:hypothetical protein
MTTPNQTELLASLHITVLSLHQYFDALATFQADLIASQRAPLTAPSVNVIENMPTQYLSLAPHFDSTIRDHAGIVEPQHAADLLPLLAKILRSFQDCCPTLPKHQQPPQRDSTTIKNTPTTDSFTDATKKLLLSALHQVEQKKYGSAQLFAELAVDNLFALSSRQTTSGPRPL